jgi:proteasome accessory factor B
MNPAPRTDRAKRLLDLVSLFLNASEPVTWAAIREAFPGDYAAGSPEASARKWERDKAELVELGVPLTWIPDSDDGPGGYVVDRGAYYLRDLSLGPDELALLSVAGAAALAQPSFPFRTDLAHALDKLGFACSIAATRPGAEGARFVMHLPAPGVEARPEILEALGRAVAGRKDVELTYRSFAGEGTRRRVSPFGLAYRRGAWFLVGHCHLRGELRTFQVARIVDLVPNEARPRTPDFDVPAGFSVQAHVAVEPWQYAVHEPVAAELRLDPEVALLAGPKFGGGARVTPADGTGAVRVEVTTTNGDALVREVLGLSPLAELVAPPALRDRAAAAAARIARAHRGEAEPPAWPAAAGVAEPPPAPPAARGKRKDADDLRDRLRRALFLVPYAVAHPGIPVAELARAARLGEDELLAELDFLRLIGRPPFTPGDYVDVVVEDGRVHLSLPQGLLRPPTLTPLEAAALDAAASALSAEGGEALARVREKLRAAVPPPARPEFDAVAGRVVVEAGSVAPETAALVDRAIRERRELELTYFAAGRGASTRRTVRPLERVLHQGYWYLHAYCCTRRERRLFRLDRAAELALSDRTFVPRPSDDRARFHAPSLAPAGARQARVRIAPGPWAEPGQVRRLGATLVSGGAAEGALATFPVDGDAYLVSLVLSLAGDAEVLEPADLRDRVRETAAAALRRHGGPSRP